MTLLVSLVLAGGSAGETSGYACCTLEDTLYAVVAETYSNPKNPRVVVSALTEVLPPGGPADSFTDRLNELDGIRGSTLSHFAERATEQRTVDALPCASAPVAIASSAMLDALPKGISPPSSDDNSNDPSEFWRAFNNRFPAARTLLRFYRAGISSERDQALVVVKYGCGSMCGGTSLFVLQRGGKAWEVIHSEPLWVS